MKVVSLIVLPVFIASVFIYGCKKNSNNTPPSPTVSSSVTLTAEASGEIEANYNDLATNAVALYNGILQLQASPTQQNLASCRQLWVNVRKDYEASEGYLFGPIVSNNIDPDIDTWPIDTTSLKAILAGSDAFTQGYVDSLPDAIKGFHGIEYILYGPLDGDSSGTKTAAEITPRQFQFMVAVGLNVQTLTAQIASIWNPSSSGNYYNQFVNAGSGSTIYPDQRAAFEDLINGMTSICGEVATQKMQPPFQSHDASLEESHFANNSISDFYYNILGLQNAYYCQFTLTANGAPATNSLSSFVKSYNISLDNTIKSKIGATLSAIKGITVPFSKAITTQPVQVQVAINACDSLSAELQNALIPFIQKYTN